MMVWMGLFWVAIILGFIWVVRDGLERRREETALTVLDRRFAEGMFSLEEYQQRRAALTEGAALPGPGRDPSSTASERIQR